jgi:hypothetical protein
MGGIEIMKKLLMFLLCVLLVVIVFVIVFNFIIIFNYHHSQSLRKRLPAREYIAHGWLVIEMVSFHLKVPDSWRHSVHANSLLEQRLDLEPPSGGRFHIRAHRSKDSLENWVRGFTRGEQVNYSISQIKVGIQRIDGIRIDFEDRVIIMIKHDEYVYIIHGYSINSSEIEYIINNIFVVSLSHQSVAACK